jgi:ABC-2 type transport system permease protein
LTLIFPALFVYLYWLFFPSSGSTSYTVLVINQDEGIEIEGQVTNAGQEAIEAIKGVSYADGSPLLTVKQADSEDEVEPMLRDRQAVVFILIPADFSRQLAAARSGDEAASVDLIFGGDLTNPYYAVAAMLATAAVDQYTQEASGQGSLLQYIEEPLGGSGTRTEFEIYVPGMFVFAIIMLVFLASMTVAQEIESGTLLRLKITRMTSIELLGGITLALVIVGVAAELLALGTALALGFRSYGPVWAAILVGTWTSLSIIGVGMIVASLSKTVAQAFIIANFPMGLFMFFSGAIYPVPPVSLFEIAGRSINLYDLLPPHHAVVALNKILTLGVGIEEILYELICLAVLSIIYFAAGAWLFQKRHLA